MIKPLARWTIGKVHPCGWEVFMTSLKLFPKIYPEFDMIVCHNNLNDKQLKKLENTDIELRSQSRAELGFPIGSSAWKLVPPRLRLDAHELWLDNDVIVQKRIPALDRWLKSTTSFIGRAIYEKQALSYYGCYKPLIKAPFPLCAGFFGLPPHFDFGKAINEIHGTKPLKLPQDEQGLTVAVVHAMEDCIIANYEEVRGLAPRANFEFKPHYLDAAALHFIDTNRGGKKLWELYKEKTKRTIKMI